MAVTPADVKAYAPEFSGEDDARIQIFIGHAQNNVNSERFLVKTDHAVLLLTLHFLAQSETSGTGGTIKSEKVGDISRSYAVPTSASDSGPLSRTRYGADFLLLMSTLTLTPIVITQSGSLDSGNTDTGNR